MAATVGVAAVSGYLLGASTARPLLAGRPLFDGFAPPPPYQWVSPPPELASQNVPAVGGSTTAMLTADGSAPAVISTGDLQVTLALKRRAVAANDGDTGVEIRVTPQAPSGGELLPEGLVIKGNVYRIEASFEPSGLSVERFDQPGQLSMIYPSELNASSSDHVILHAVDGTSWAKLDSFDIRLQHQVLADLRGPGLVAVGGVAVAPQGRGTRVLWIAAAIGLSLIGVAIAVFQWRRDRAPARTGRRR